MRRSQFLFVTLFAVSALWSVSVSAQQIAGGEPIRVMRPTVAANGDATAVTPEAIFAVNRELALSGNRDAAFQLGLAYMQGSGVTQDLAQAERWFLMGAVEPLARTWVAGLHKNGIYFEKDASRAVEWYELAGNSEGLFAAARLYQLGDGVAVDLPMAIDIYVQLLGKNGDPYVRRAQMELGNLVIDGKYTSGNAGKDLEWARIIAQQLVGDEVYNLAWSPRGSAMDLPTNPWIKEYLLKRAASYNIYSAQQFLGKGMLERGDGEGYAWWHLAGQYDAIFGMPPGADAGLSPSQIRSGQMALETLQKTHAEAGAYYQADDPLRAPDVDALAKLLTDGADPDAELRLAYAYELKAGDPGFAERSMALYRQVRDNRVAEVRLKLGNEYRRGLDEFPQDAVTAAAWYGFAAKAGSAEACRALAEMTNDGQIRGTSGSQK